MPVEVPSPSIPDTDVGPSGDSASAPSLGGVRVACFYPWIPFEPSGAWNRFTSMWRFLSREGAEVTLAFMESGEAAQLQGVSVRYLGNENVLNNVGNVARKLIEGKAKSELKEYSTTELTLLLMHEKDIHLAHPPAAAWLDDIIASHELVTCEYTMHAALLSAFCRKHRKRLVITSHDMLFELHGRHPGAKERLKRKELAGLASADAVVFCNEPERQAFAALGVAGDTVLSTGDTLGLAGAAFEAAAARAAIREELKIATTDYCLFVGSAHEPNLEAARAMRALAQAMPDLTFVVAGNCAAKATERNFLALGRVADPLLERLYCGTLAVLVPLRRGTGISVKTFQAAAYGRAVISTAVGVRGWALRDGIEVLLAEVENFPAAIGRLRQEPGLAAKLGHAARQYAVGLDFRSHFRPYAKIINRLVPGPRTPTEYQAPALILVDNNLSGRAGHHFNYALALRNACTEAGQPLRALIRRSADADILEAVGGHGVFSQGLHEASANPYPAKWHSLRTMYDFLRANEAFARDFEEGLALAARPYDHVFLPNATPGQILGLALVLSKNPLYRTLRFSLLLRYTTFAAVGLLAERRSLQDRALTEHYGIALEKLLSLDASLSIRLATDSDGLAREYGPIANRPIEVWPIPHTAAAPSAQLLPRIPAKEPARKRVVFLGDAREEKGFELLPTAVRACLGDPDLAAVEFVFQAHVSHPCHHRMAMVIAELRNLGSPQVKLIEDALTPGEYQALLETSDLVLLPYDAVTYRARTSGPFVEALCAEKPTLVPAGSWMSQQLQDTPAGGTFHSGDGSDLGRALRAMLSALPAHARAAAELGRTFRDFHNPASFLRHLQGAAGTR